MLVPKLVTTLKTYNRAQVAAVAGIIVGVVALPLAIAFAIGVTPDRGLYTAVIAGFLMRALAVRARVTAAVRLA